MARPVTGAIDKTQAAYYRALAKGETKTLRSMEAAYRVAEKRLENALRQTELKLSTEPNNLNQAYRAARFENMIKEARFAALEVGAKLGDELAIQQLALAKEADRLTQEAAGSLDPGFMQAGLQSGFKSLNTSAINALVGSLGDGSPLHTLGATLGNSIASDLGTILAKGIALGQNPRVIGRDLTRAFSGLTRARANTIARTEMLRTFREASRQSMIANSHIIKRWRWSAGLDPRTCALCWAMHGREFELSTKMATHPNCRCVMLPVTKTFKELGIKGVQESYLGYKFNNTGPEMFKGLSQPEKIAVLGRGGTAAYNLGLLKLEDYEANTFHPQWGAGRRAKSLREILGPERAKGLYGKAPKRGQGPLTKAQAAAKAKAQAAPNTALAKVADPSTHFYIAPGQSQARINELKKLAEQTNLLHKLPPAKGAVGDLDLLLEDNMTATRGSLGEFARYRDGVTGEIKPKHIALDPLGPHIASTMDHEFGHYVDIFYLDSADKYEIYKAIQESPSFKELQQLETTWSPFRNGAFSKSYHDYLTSEVEVFARAYAQWGAGKRKDLISLTAMENHANIQSYYQQWTRADFGPIHAAFEALWKRKGWDIP
jgi:SPP1 gp7 family putative phage head morphogenesis protein